MVSSSTVFAGHWQGGSELEILTRPCRAPHECPCVWWRYLHQLFAAWDARRNWTHVRGACIPELLELLEGLAGLSLTSKNSKLEKRRAPLSSSAVFRSHLRPKLSLRGRLLESMQKPLCQHRSFLMTIEAHFLEWESEDVFV